MVLPVLTHKRGTPVAVASPYGIDDVLEAFETCLTATTFYDGVTRTPGTNAWTRTTELDTGTLVALRCDPPSPASGTTSHQVVIAGHADAKTPVMCTNETYLASRLLVGCFKDVPGTPSWNGWDNATPYTDAAFTGYARSGPTVTNNRSVMIIESLETILFVLTDTNNLSTPAHAGAIWAAANPATEAETDERLYGISTMGSAAALAGNCHSVGPVTTSETLYGHGTSAGQLKCVMFLPDDTATGIVNAMQLHNSAPMTATCMRGTTGSIVGMPINCWLITPTAAGNFVGMVREVHRLPDLASHTVVEEGSTDVWYVISSDIDLPFDAYGFKA